VRGAHSWLAICASASNPSVCSSFGDRRASPREVPHRSLGATRGRPLRRRKGSCLEGRCSEKNERYSFDDRGPGWGVIASAPIGTETDSFEDLRRESREPSSAEYDCESSIYGSWSTANGFITRARKIYQVDLLSPEDRSIEYSAVYHQSLAHAPQALWRFSTGRGAQEKTFAELKCEFALDGVPTNHDGANTSVSSSRSSATTCSAAFSRTRP
jgi:hypothetical protein